MAASSSKAALLAMATEDDAIDYETLVGQLSECRRLLHLYEIDNTALKSRCEVAENKTQVLEKQGLNLENEIERLENDMNNLTIDRNFLREEVAKGKLYIVKLQDILDLKQRSDKARLRSWDVFKALYTLDTDCTDLSFTAQRLDDEGAVIVAEALDVFTSLHTLNLSDNIVAAKGMEALSIPLSLKTSLTTLSMHGNKLGDNAMATVGMVLSSISLKSLNVGLNEISCEGAAVLASTLSPDMPASQYLTSLNLSQNSIAVRGSQALAQALLRNTTLKTLNLADNQVADFGIPHIAAMLRVNNGITDLNLSNNDIRETGVRELCSSIVENELLKTIRLVNNDKMGTEGTKALTTLQKSMALSRKLRVYF